MAFHFPLETVLRYRKSIEETEELKLKALFARRAVLMQELKNLERQRSALSQATRSALEQGPVYAVEVHFVCRQQEAIAARQHLLVSALRDLQNQLEEQKGRLTRARRNRESLDMLRDASWKQYQQIQQRREQAARDEIYLIRRTYNRA